MSTSAASVYFRPVLCYMTNKLLLASYIHTISAASALYLHIYFDFGALWLVVLGRFGFEGSIIRQGETVLVAISSKTLGTTSKFIGHGLPFLTGTDCWH
jgi:uncharacterized membrane protein YGL010W